MRLRALAPAKVNLCLFLGGLRPDGRHELVTLFESVSLADEIELTTRVALEDEVSCPGVPGPNIVARALVGLRARGWDAPRVIVRIDKRIPVAAGMGGGSADAAALLRIAQRVSPMPKEVIADLAQELGADVPGQLAPGVVLGTGAGDEVAPAPPQARHALLIVAQPHQLSTADVYREADRLGLARTDAELTVLRDDLASTLESAPQLDSAPTLESAPQLPERLLVNDLESAATALWPPIKPALDAAREAGADHALVCGSGPTVAGLFWGEDGERRARAAAAQLVDAFPSAHVAVPVERGYGAPLFA